MRFLLCHLLSVALVLTAAACSDPKCQPGELRTGTKCRPARGLPDGSTDTPGASERFDASAEGEREDEASKDGAVHSSPDGSVDGAQTEDAADSQDPDAILDGLPGGPPAFQFRADSVTLNGASVTSMPNRRGSDALVVAPAMLSAPANGAALGGAPALVFNGTQWLDSNLPPKSWSFLHDGTGAEVFIVHRPGSGDTQTLLGTTRQQDAISTFGFSAFVNESSGTTQLLVGNAGNPRPVDLTSATALAAGTATYANWQFGGPGVVSTVFDRQTSVSASTAFASTPSAEPPQNTLRVGANAGSGDRGFRGAIAEILIFTRSLHEYERQLVREYIDARYGIPAPVLTGPERVIMSALPFAMASAERYVSAGGKVSALLDLARPGHVFAQGDPNFQPGMPSAEGSLNGQLALTLTNHAMQSGLPADAWMFVHAVESTVFHVLRTGPDVVSTQILAESWNSGNGISQSVTKDLLATAYYRPSPAGSAPHPAARASTAYLWSASIDATTMREKATGSSESSAPAVGMSSSAGKSMVLFARGTNMVPFVGKWARSIWFGPLSAAKRAEVEAALGTLYGVAP